MILLPFRRTPRGPNIDALYGMIVAQARTPAFYRSYGVADTLDGRLDMIVLHLVLLLRRLAAAGAEPSVGQRVFDRFCQDMDDNFREMGVGDLAVPKEMRRVAEVFYGRAKAYEAALAAQDVSELTKTLARNVFGRPEPHSDARRLAAYMMEAVRRLGDYDATALAGARLEFPDPDAIAMGVTQAQQDERTKPH
jgi:cytochrome b pre-mRNA-processing protein 3